MVKEKIKNQNVLTYFCNNQSRRKKKFPNQIYISKTDLKNFHEDEKGIILDPIKMLNESKIHDYVDSLMKTVFTSFEKQNDIIGECELEMTLNAIDLSYELYRQCFETKLRSGLFTPTQVDCIHRKIFTFVLKSLLETCDFNKDQKILVETCKTELKMKAENLYESLSTEYQKKFDATAKLLNKIKTNAINVYCSETNAKLSEPPRSNNNEFNDFHHEISRKAMELLNNSTEYFEQQFDEVFSKKLILETRSIIRNKINSKKVLFKRQNKEKTVKSVTLAKYGENIGSTEQSTRVNTQKTEGEVLSTTLEQVAHNDIRVQLEHHNYESKLNISNSEKSELITETENENELNFVQTDKSINDVHKKMRRWVRE
jgi:hypothetical protein